MGKRNERPTQNDLGATAEEIAALRDRLDAGFREATRHGFDGAKVAEWSAGLDEEAAQLGLDPDQLELQLFASGIASAFAAYDAHNAREADLDRSVRGEQRRRLRRRLDQVDERQGYRSRVVVVRDLHNDPTGRSVRDFLGTPTATRRHRPAAAARSRRPRRSSSSSRTSGADPGDGDDSEPAGVAPHACRRKIAGGRP